MGISIFSRFSRYYHTVRHLKTQQLWYMGKYRVLPQHHRSPYVAPFEGASLWSNVSHRTRFEAPVSNCENIVSEDGELTFLHKRVHLGWPPSWGLAEEQDLLWRFNLHYHNAIWGLPFDVAKVLVGSWIDCCEFAQGAASWRPYVISVRLGNWLKYFLCTHANRCQAESDFTEKLVKSVAAQASWLLKNLEIHLLGNHLFENAFALYMIGMFFDGPLAKTCAKRGLSLLQGELNEQILPDGGHFERSPMYHLRCLYLLADLYNLGVDKDIPQLGECLLRMWQWLQYMCHPDGQIALFNDAAHNVYLNPESLSSYLSRLLQKEPPRPSGPFSLPESGYYGWNDVDGEYLVCDAGPVGPDYQPGHAHADMFSFELSVNGERMIVDSGTSTYSRGPERDYLRGTAAHNTVEVSGENQVDVWGGFRVGRRVKPCNVRFTPSADGFELSAAHNGYQRDFGLIHRRTFVFRKNQNVRISDVFVGATNRRILMRLHFPPGCVVTAKGGYYAVKKESVLLRVFLKGYAMPQVESGSVAFDLGKAEAAQSLVLPLRDGTNSGDLTIVWGEE